MKIKDSCGDSADIGESLGGNGVFVSFLTRPGGGPVTCALYTPAKARRFAAAIIRHADAIDRKRAKRRSK